MRVFLFKLFFGLILVISWGALAKENIKSQKKFIFEHNFKEVWAAAQIVLGTYPLETNDIKNGLIRTSLLKPGQFWQPPFETPIDGNYTQSMSFQFYKTNSYETELQIQKTANLQMDFLGSNKSVEREPWEELRLVYKIKREIEIKKVLAQIK